MVARYEWIFLVLVLCAVTLFAQVAHAQFGILDPESALSITLSPTSPSPDDTVLLSVQSSVVDISRSDIRWQANGKTIAQGRGVDSTSVNAGVLGSETRITVTVTASDGSSTSAQATILPTELDILIDSDSYIPPFYRGWPRPSAGTNLRVQAVPRFKRGNATVSASTLTYTWRRNGQVLGTLSGIGKSTAIIPVQNLFGTETISVEARSADDLLSHTVSLPLSATAPVLMLYQNHPLYGTLYHRALAPSTFIPETEMTFAAIPFFVQTKKVYDRALTFDWRVNTAEIPANTANPNELTINAQNSSGIALVELHVTHATNYFLDAKGAWNITFSSGVSESDQFGVSQ